MPQSLLESDLPGRVTECLQMALPNAEVSQHDAGEGMLPMVVLARNPILAGFAFGEDEATYARLYSSFKEIFKLRSQEWAVLDVCFVYCLPPGVQLPESAHSRIETDVFFCRKYVVPVGESIETSLLRLPFFPLAPLAGTPLRPPSAQTFLQGAGLPAELTRHLIVQHVRGAQGILADCLEGKFGVLQSIASTQTSSHQLAESGGPPTTLESISIENFRAESRRPSASENLSRFSMGRMGLEKHPSSTRWTLS